MTIPTMTGKDHKKNISIILNVLIIIFEIVGLALAYDSIKAVDLSYYTIDSNIFLLITSILYLIYRNKHSKIISLLKYSSTLSVSVTFLVVILVLLPMLDFNFTFLFLEHGGLYLHLLCPLTALITFIFFENHEIDNVFKNNLRAVYFTIIYAVILISLNILKIVNGPYPFLKVYEQSVFASILWTIAILGGTLVLSRLLLSLNEFFGILY
ncbi:MAG: hypothetical protein K6A34_05820 [Methanobrevibacter sp.]|nr:hypothetical protein [Methanobrevibacter sp.]